MCGWVAPRTSPRFASGLDHLVRDLRGRIADDLYAKVGSIRDSILATLPKDGGIDGLGRDVYLIRQTALDYLPAALNAYLALPRRYAERRPCQRANAPRRPPRPAGPHGPQDGARWPTTSPAGHGPPAGPRPVPAGEVRGSALSLAEGGSLLPTAGRCRLAAGSERWRRSPTAARTRADRRRARAGPRKPVAEREPSASTVADAADRAGGTAGPRARLAPAQSRFPRRITRRRRPSSRPSIGRPRPIATAAADGLAATVAASAATAPIAASAPPAPAAGCAPSSAPSATAPPSAAGGASSTPLLDKIGRDLTRLAAKGQLGPVIGRTQEMDWLVETLVRRDEAQPGPPRAGGRRQDLDRGGPRPADRRRKGARPAQGHAAHRGAAGVPRRRHPVPRPARGAPRTAVTRGVAARGSSCSSTRSISSRAPARAKAAWAPMRS